MQKLTPIQKDIINKLIYFETFGSIQEELKLHDGALRDDLHQLAHFGFIEIKDQSGRHVGSSAFDTNRMEEFMYRATKKGLSSI